MGIRTRIMPFFRTKNTNYNGGLVTTNGSLQVGNSDYNGNLWVRSIESPTQSVFNDPGAGVQAKFMTGLLFQPVLTSIHATLTAAAAATAIHQLQVGAWDPVGMAFTTFYLQKRISAPANTTISIDITGLQISTLPQALGIQFAAAPAAGEFQTVGMTYFTQ